MWKHRGRKVSRKRRGNYKHIRYIFHDIYIYIDICIYNYIYIYRYIDICIYNYIYIDIYVYIIIYIYIYIYIYIDHIEIDSHTNMIDRYSYVLYTYL